MNSSNKKCLIISGGENSLENYSEEFYKSFDFIIACDKGYEYASKINLTPNLIMGDFDSMDSSVQFPADIEVQRFPCEKDDTDTMMAIKYALEKKIYDEIHIVCAFGNRLDHTIANIQAAAFIANNKTTAFLYGKNDEAICFANSTIHIPKKEKYSLSVFSLSDKAEGVTIKGTKYKVENVQVSSAFPIGQSNEWEDDEATISVKKGIMLIISSRIE